VELEPLEARTVPSHCHISLYDNAFAPRDEIGFDPPWPDATGHPTEAEVPTFPVAIPQTVDEVSPGSPAAFVTYYVTTYSCSIDGAGCPSDYSVDLHIISQTAERGIDYDLPDLTAAGFFQSSTKPGGTVAVPGHPGWGQTGPSTGDFVTTLKFDANGVAFGTARSITITIPIISDTTFQDPRTFKVQLKNAQNTRLGNDAAEALDGVPPGLRDHFRDPSEGIVTVEDFLPRPDPQIDTVNGVAVTVLGEQAGPLPQGPTISVPEGPAAVDPPRSVPPLQRPATSITSRNPRAPTGTPPPGADRGA